MQAVRGSHGAKMIVFPAGGGKYGLPLEWVLGISEKPSVAGTAPEQEEKGNRGNPAFDLATWLDGQEVSTCCRYCLIVGRGEERVAVGVDGPGRVVETGELLEWPRLYRKQVDGIFTGILVENDSLVLIIDPEGLLRAVNRGGLGGSQGGEG